MEKDNGGLAGRDELLANVRRLTRIALDRLEEGVQDGSLDQAQIRMLGSLAVRALRLWHVAVGKEQVPVENELSNAEIELARTLSGAHQSFKS